MDEQSLEEKKKLLGGDIELTIYNQDLGLVKEIKEFDLKIGVDGLKYTNITAQLDPGSVIFKDLTDENTEVLEQDYENDLENNSKLLDKYIGKEITITDKIGITYTGKLLKHEPGIILQKKDKCIMSFTEVSKIEFPDTEGLFTKPTLVWQVRSSYSGKRDVLISYLTTGINWRAEYVLNVNADYTKADVRCWIGIDNRTGANFENAKLKLVAGDVHRIYSRQPGNTYLRKTTEKLASVLEASAYDFAEENLFEYHIYLLERLTSLKNNQTKQISLFSASSVLIEKELVFDSWKNDKVQVLLKTENSEEKGLGLPLPKGLIRVYKADSEKQFQFIGEDQIEHIPQDGKIKVIAGNAFDIKGTRTQKNYERISDTIEQITYEIEFNNSRSEVQEIKAVEHFSGDWEIIKNSDFYEKTDAFTAEFQVSIAANSTKVISYTVENKLQLQVR